MPIKFIWFILNWSLILDPLIRWSLIRWSLILFFQETHESFCFDQRGQSLIQLIGSIMIKCFVVHLESIVKLFCLVFYQHCLAI